MTYTLPVYVNTVNSATPDYVVPYSQNLTGGTIEIASDADKAFKKLTVGGSDYKLEAPFTSTGVKVSLIHIDVASGEAYAIDWAGYRRNFTSKITTLGSGQITATFAAACITVLTAAGCTYEAEGWHQIFPGRGSEQGVNDFYAGELGCTAFAIKNGTEEQFNPNFKVNGLATATFTLNVAAGKIGYMEFGGALRSANGDLSSDTNNIQTITALQILNETVPEGITYYVR